MVLLVSGHFGIGFFSDYIQKMLFIDLESSTRYLIDLFPYDSQYLCYTCS